jgi:predicted ATPase
MEKLLVANFGSLKEIDITLKNLTIFIGKTGTGKSTLAKLIAIFRQPNFFTESQRDEETHFEKCLSDYKIDSYLQDNTFIAYVSQWFTFQYNAKLEPKLLITATFELNSLLFEYIGNDFKDKDNSEIRQEFLNKLIPKNIYIPTERMLLSIFQDGQFDDNLKKIIPKTLDEFGKYWKVASMQLQKYHTSIFNVTYKRKGTEDYVLLPDGKELKLSVSASGMQTLIPALLVLDYYTKDKEDKHSFTFEEPELNLFPTAQKDLVEFLAEKVLNNGHQLVICTHSPYILTSFNNLLYAYEVQKQFPASQEKVFEVISQNKLVSSAEIAIYYLPLKEEFEEYETYAVDLLDKETGLIPDNDLDSASEYIVEDFKQLIAIYREYQKTNRKPV